MARFNHTTLERRPILLVLCILIVVSIGGIVELVPLFFLESTIEKVKGMRPYTPLELAGRNIYVREGCYNCHSQMIRTFRDEIECYGHYSLAAANVAISPSTASDLSQTKADFVFQGASLAPVLATWRLARRADRLVLQNVAFALAYNAVAIPASMAGLVPPLIAALAMSGSSIVVSLNALRVRQGRAR